MATPSEAELRELLEQAMRDERDLVAQQIRYHVVKLFVSRAPSRSRPRPNIGEKFSNCSISMPRAQRSWSLMTTKIRRRRR